MKKEGLRVLPVFLFFLFFFTVINWTETYLFEEAGITPFRFFEVFLAAALIAKIILVVDHLPLVKFFRRKVLIYQILWKTAVYWFILLLVRLLIRFIPFLFGERSALFDFELVFNEINWRLFISIQSFYLLLLFIFEVFEGLVKRVGIGEARRIFFGK
ncbi:MAG: hypothetical protein A3E80_01710 [Chlamydiae bacterium RIFCSPHIGHO2_12_FULL_49_9]|nr:MAG: hypothetical protein A3E80_01710 [Chlamydiae bacterium RIFCSPHIGHO2_12_FULL_49_9]